MPSSLDILQGLNGVLDKKSHEVLELLRMKKLILSSEHPIRSVEILEFEENLPFMEVFDILSQEKIVPARAESVLEMLYLLKGEENQKNRETFFKEGLILLSLDAILIDGEVQYLIVGENTTQDRKHGQHPFSLRLVSLPQIFSHSFYRLITIK
jgi:hypothetical protein